MNEVQAEAMAAIQLEARDLKDFARAAVLTNTPIPPDVFLRLTLVVDRLIAISRAAHDRG